MLGLGHDILAAAARRPGGPPDWPEGARALWLIFGQSNAEGFAPWRQDPGRADPGAAVAALAPAERAAHPWLRLSTRGAGPDAGRFGAAGQGLATDATPRTSSKVWTGGGFGIPDGTPSFGPEIGLVRHVLSGAAPGWRDDAAPRLFVFKQTEGGRSVDHFRWGGPGAGLILDALRRGAGETLSSLAAAGPVLIQGVIFVIGEKDATDARADGAGAMAETLAVRFGDWVRQVRGALGVRAPVLFVEIHDALDARKVEANAALAALAAATPDAAVLARTPAWTDIGDGVHYDAAAQDLIGAAAFAHFRDAYGRPGDGLVTDRVFTGLAPWFHVPPVFTDDVGDRMRLSVVPSCDGTLHAAVTAAGAPAPPAGAIRAGSSLPGGFARAVTADVETDWHTPAGSFAPGETQDVHVVLEDGDGRLGETATLRRSGGARFGPDLALVSAGTDAAVVSARPTFAGELHWALHEGVRGPMRPEDVEAEAFRPAAAGRPSCGANADVTITVEGLAPTTSYTFFLTGRRGSDGARAVVQRVSFATI